MHGRAPDFRLYHGNSLDVLAQLLADELRTPAPGQPLLAPDMVLIPQPAMRRWLQATLAQAHGIAANLEFLTPGEFVQRALDANVPGTADDLDADALHWRLYAALTDPALLRQPALRSLRVYLQSDRQAGADRGGDDPLKPWSLAGELAAVFEKYQAWRRDWLLAWEGGADRGDPQAALWRHIAGGRRHRARRIDEYLTRFPTGIDPTDGETAAEPAGLPSRLFVFATLNVSPDVLRVIASQARVGTLHFYLPTPTRKYWGDLRTLAERLRDGDEAAAFGIGAAGDDNPLLQAFGAAGRDFMAVLGGYEIVHPSGEIAAYADPETDPADEPARDTLLQRLQRDLLHRRGLPAMPWRDAVDLADPSLQVHACHTRLREVQVLHDQLRGLLEDPRFDPPLQPREIAVLAPDIDPYAPHVEAVFGGHAGRVDFIPYALADASPLAAEPLAEVFLRLLALPLSRFGLGEVFDLLATPALAEQAGLDPATLERLRDWLQAAGARWGLDAAHRARLDAPADDACTWAFALDRLLLGYASGEGEGVRFAGIAGSTTERPATDGRAGLDGVGQAAPGMATHGLIAGIAPWPELEGNALDSLDVLLRLLRVLADHQRAFATAMTPLLWHERLLGLLDTLLPQRPRALSDQRALERLRTLVDDFAASAGRASFGATLPPEVVRAHFQAVLHQTDTKAPLLSGGVSFGRMVPMRLIPFRAICLLGMNDGDYPRRDPVGGLNRLSAALGSPARRRGDRSLRDDDRFLFLQLIAAAGDVLYVSYVGADPRDGSVREPSLVVSELLDVAARYHTSPDEARRQLTVRHPLQPFAPAAFGAADDAQAADEPRRFSYRSQWRPAALTDGARVTLAPWLDAPLPPLARVAETVSLAELRAFLRDPPAAFLRQRLALRLPDDIDASRDIEPLQLPGRGLLRHRLRQAVFEACVQGDIDDLHAALRARAMLPSGPLGRRQLDTLLGEVRPYAEAFTNWRSGGTDAAGHRPFELDIDGLRLHGQLDQMYDAGLARFRFDTLHGPAQIAHGLDWLVLSALGDRRPLVQFAQTSAGKSAGCGPHIRGAIDPGQARSALQGLLTLRSWGLRDPLPFLPRAGWAWYDAVINGTAGNRGKDGWSKAEQQWRGGDRAWGEATTPAARLALRGGDPFGSSAADAELGEAFRDIARIVFDAVVHGRSEQHVGAPA